MARSIRSKLEGRSTRLTLRPRRKPYYERIGTGCWLGYRRLKTNGRWVLRVLKGGSEWTKAFAEADDYDESNQKSIMTYFEAQTYAKTLAGAGRDGTAKAGERPVTVAQAVDAYEANLRKHGRDPTNAVRIRYHLKAAKGLGNIAVSALVAGDFKAWGQSFEGLAPATTNRVNSCLKAALNLARKHDKRIANADEWTVVLERVGGPDANKSRNVILLQPTINAIIATAYSLIGPEFGLLVEVAAQTGARYSQLVRLTVGNVHLSGNPHLMMPVSRKGWGKKDTKHRPVPITADLAHRLSRVGAIDSDRPTHAPLLMKTDDAPWTILLHCNNPILSAWRLKIILRYSNPILQSVSDVESDETATDHHDAEEGTRACDVRLVPRQPTEPIDNSDASDRKCQPNNGAKQFLTSLWMTGEH